ncbi:hypothetical protein CVT24_008161 [Panaeolus cyanescens]|uniref:Uncharacterized protein n=1 Tax=Panaeolus cyanescens TaxID=181874 RepID=A0A409VFE1_9AGAR|nr:hypothetical protein CVT24_008161 [Panaeolus cyanescens]
MAIETKSVDPFRPSISFSVKNLYGWMRRPETQHWTQQGESKDDSLSSAELRHLRLRPASRRFMVYNPTTETSDTETSPALSPSSKIPAASESRVVDPTDETLNHHTPPIHTTDTKSVYILALAFVVDTIPRQLYLHLLLRIPYLYFTRVSRIFQEAEISISEFKVAIMKMAGETKRSTIQMPMYGERDAAFKSLHDAWPTFVDSLQEEWRTLNIVSVLLLT